MVTVRKEQNGDEAKVRFVNLSAFGQPAEPDLVDVLRRSCPEGVSLVAVQGEEIVGHILFTPVVIKTKEQEIWGMGLAPMAVLPEYQLQGIGSKLIMRGIELMKDEQHPFIIVLGHPTYYPRFGFVPADQYGISCQYSEVPPEAFMILVLDQTLFQNVTGVAKYRLEFDAVT